MTIVQLEYFLAVANCGSFSIAAEQCFVTQPSLSMQIKNLEEELGVILLDRTRKPVIATEAGVIVLDNIRETLKAYNNIKESVCALKGEISGVLRLGVIPTIAPYLLHRFVPAFIKKYEKVDLQIKEMITPDILKALEKDQLDAAIIAGGTCTGTVIEEELFDDKFYAYVSPMNKLYARTSVRIEDIDVEELMLLSDGNCLKDQILELCQPRHNARYNNLFESGSLDTLMRLVDNTDALTIIPEMATIYIPDSKKAQLKQFAKGATSRKVAVVVRRTYVKHSLVEVLKKEILLCVKK